MDLDWELFISGGSGFGLGGFVDFTRTRSWAFAASAFEFGFGCSELFPPRNVTVMRKQSGTPKVHVSPVFWLRLIRVGPISTVDMHRG